MIKTYLLHHRDFKERFKYISNRLNEEDIEFEIIDMYHPNSFNYDEMMSGYEEFKPGLIEFGPPGQTQYHSYMNFSKKISPSSVSLNMKHIHAWKDQLDKNHDVVLILEDDAEIPFGFKETLNRIYMEFMEPTNQTDICMIGDGYGWHTPIVDDSHIIHYNKSLKTRCTHAYLINKKCAKVMIDNFKIFNLPIDFKMNEIIQFESIPLSWYEPGIKQKKFENENTIDR